VIVRNPFAPRRQDRTATIDVRGDVVIATARNLYRRLQGAARSREVTGVVVDFGQAGRVDTAGVAVVALGRRMVESSRKSFDVANLDDRHRAALELATRDAPAAAAAPIESVETPVWLERVGERVVGWGIDLRDLGRFVAALARQTVEVATARKRLRAGTIASHAVTMGVDALLITGMLGFFLGMTMAFQGIVALQKLGAGVFVAELIGVSMTREFGPMMTAIILTGRTGAAIAAELGTMQVRSEVDALRAMGVDPVRFLVVPRVVALMVVLPALVLMVVFIGIFGAMLVTNLTIDMPFVTFWDHMSERVVLGDWVHGLGKSFVFAWIIGVTGSFLGLRASGDASSVGAATTRAVVASITMIVMVDAAFATVSAMGDYQ
jgi:phospholipid/cholesterol/gamma-HCH transport system permease protein